MQEKISDEGVCAKVDIWPKHRKPLKSKLEGVAAWFANQMDVRTLRTTVLGRSSNRAETMMQPFKLDRQPNFERLRRVLMCEGEPDRVPFIELGVHPIFKSQMIGRPCVTVADEIEFAQRAGYDYIKLQPAIDMNPAKIMPAAGPQIFELEEGAGQRRWADEHTGVITNWQEFERYVWPCPQEVSYARFEEACRLLPDELVVIGQYGDIFTLVWELMGFRALRGSSL